MSRFLPKKAHSTKNNDAFTHCGISLSSPNTLQQKYSSSLKSFMFQFHFISSGKRRPLWSSFQENDPYMRKREKERERKRAKQKTREEKVHNIYTHK